MKVGVAFDGYIESDVVTTTGDDAYDSISYSIASGSMPAGISLSSEEGRFTGTPTEAGTFTFTVLVTAEKESGGGSKGGPKMMAAAADTPMPFTGGGSTTTKTEFEYVVTMVVAEGESVDPQFRVDAEGMIQYSEDGGKTWIDVINKDDLKGDQGPQGPQGPEGPQGEPGKDGEDGKTPEGGCGSVAGGTIAIVGAGLVAAAVLAFVLAPKKKNNDR